MKLRDSFKPKRLALSFCIGVGFFLVVSSLAAASNESSFFVVFLRPGSLLASLVGYGGHDLPGMLLYFLGNILFYWLLALFFLGWWRTRRRVHVGDHPASEPADTTTTH